MKTNKPILEQISTIRNLPTLPSILVKLIRVCSKNEIDLQEVSKIVEKDPSLSSRILKLINSSYYGLSRKIEGIHQAVAYLGTNAIKNIAISASICQSFHPAGGDKSLFNLKTFWWHSIRCAVLAKLLAKNVQYNNPDDAFLAGLLHDIGRLVLWVNFSKEYAELLKKHRGRPDLLLAGEIKLGATHCEVGAWLLRRWDLQSFMADSVLYHHEPLEKILNALSLVQIVFAANILSYSHPGLQETDYNEIEQLYGFNRAEIDELLSRADDELEDVARLLGIEIEPPSEKKGSETKADRKNQEELLREVRNTSLLFGTLQSLLEVNDKTGILNVVHQGLQILFDVRDILFFLHDQDKDGLIGEALGDDNKFSIIRDVIIPMKSKESLLITSLIKGKTVDSFSTYKDFRPVIIDSQIIQLINKEGILCLPLIAHGNHVGVIVLGLDRAEFSHLTKFSNLLKMFTNQSAIALYAWQVREAQTKKIQVERLGASSDIARKVVHEVNNPLGIIKNYLKILSMKLSSQDTAQEEIKILNEEIDRIGHILQTLTTFSEDKILDIRPVDINTTLSDIVRITKEPLSKRAGVDIYLDLDEDLPAVMAEKGKLKQVFINLIKNAAEAMPGGGNLYIKTQHIYNQIKGGTKDNSHGYVEIIFSDDGPGIPPEVKSRLFEPFVSSKDDHSGLGLSIVHNLIKLFNGVITCESEVGKGTTFKIDLPAILSDN